MPRVYECTGETSECVCVPEHSERERERVRKRDKERDCVRARDNIVLERKAVEEGQRERERASLLVALVF